jgi:hypothetical protein
MAQVALTLDGKPYQFPAETTPSFGAAETLFFEGALFGGDRQWRSQGFAVVDLLSPPQITAMAEGLARRVARDLVELQPELTIDATARALLAGQYHRLGVSDEIHRQLVRRTANYRHEDLPLPVGDIYRRLGQLVQATLSEANPKLTTEIVTVRLSRPGSLDFNPPHKDVYLDFYRGTLNVWMPLVGCSEDSTLPVVPGSHLWPEDQIERGVSGNLFNGLRFNVPIVFRGPQPLAFIRPRVKPGQALVFTPNLVHGCAMNLNRDVTRMSLELRPVWSV